MPFAAQPSLAGPTLTLQPLVAADFEPLLAAASDPLIWAQHPEPTRHKRAAFEVFFAKALASGGALTVRDGTTGEVLGSSRYYDWEEAAQSITIGYTFLVRSRWGGSSNGELKRLMLEHAFHQAKRVWFHIGADNLRSRRAIEKIGGVLDHTDKVRHGDVELDYCFYRIDAPAR
jgi:RimJ/RimL family protein N-acetyltransferase